LHKITLSHARAVRLSFLPRFRAFEVRVPEWPSAALRWSYWVDRASTGLPVEKGAISIGKLAQSEPTSAQPCMVDSEFADRNSAIIGDRLHFFFGDPYDPWPARTTVSTLCAFKTETLLIPRLGRCHFMLLKEEFKSTPGFSAPLLPSNPDGEIKTVKFNP